MRCFFVCLAVFIVVSGGAEGETHLPTSVSVISWNLAERSPRKSHTEFITPHADSDVVVVGVQECENMKPRRQEGHRIRRWRRLCSRALGGSMRRLCSHKMEGMHISLFAKRKLNKKNVKIAGVTEIACGVGNVIGNKGAVCIFAEISGQRLAFVNTHLPAHQHNIAQRLSATTRIMKEVETEMPIKWRRKGGLDALDGILFFGDLNSRLELPRLETELAALQIVADGSNDWESLLDYDQLRRQLVSGQTLGGFREHPIAFPPTFKYDLESDEFDTSKKQRTPSWTDRILYKNRLATNPALRITTYNAAMHVRHSDHRPVHARFRIQ